MIGEIRTYDDLHAVLRARVAELGVTREALDEIAGLPRGYTGKILGHGQVKRVGPISLEPLLTALGLKLVAVDDEEAIARFGPVVEQHRTVRPRNFELGPEVERRARELMHERAVSGGRARASKLTPEQRRQQASAAARGRWKRKRKG